MKTRLLTVIVSFAGLLSLHGAESLKIANSVPIVMHPFEVRNSGLDINVVYDGDRIRWVEVVNVAPNSPADKAGLKPGMRILKIQSKAVIDKTREEFYSKVLEQRVAQFHVIIAEEGDLRREFKIPVFDPNRKKSDLVPISAPRRVPTQRSPSTN